MSRLVGDVYYAEDEPPGICTSCGAFRELRPFGEQGKRICHPCCEADPKAKKRFLRKIKKARTVVVMPPGRSWN